MFSELLVAFEFIVKYGAVAVTIILLGVIILLLRKLLTNHLTHIQDGIQSVLTQVTSTNGRLDTTNQKIDQIDAKQDQLGERVSKLEGRLEGPKKTAKLKK